MASRPVRVLGVGRVVSVSLGEYSAAFQAEVENLGSNYRNTEAERSRVQDPIR
jgi:hypothetical protein